ncbi:hypothetical protein A4L30_10730 [Salmonella enterica subsp. enterica serovar Bovismorbificans]|nr:hypothetical protein [Salmonella enterica subsp. enterica serovar Bovismorbificans]
MENKFINTPVKSEEIKQAMTLAAIPEARIPAAGHWISERIGASLSIWASGGFFDIPNGWVADAPGIVKMHVSSHSAIDAVLSVNGLVDAESHQAVSSRGWCKSTLVGRGATVNFGVSGDRAWIDWFRFKRIH